MPTYITSSEEKRKREEEITTYEILKQITLDAEEQHKIKYEKVQSNFSTKSVTNMVDQRLDRNTNYTTRANYQNKE